MPVVGLTDATFPITIRFLLIFIFPPTYVFALTPIPPVTIIVPVVEVIDSTFPLTIRFLLIFIFPPTYVFALIPTPPVIRRSPEFVLVDSIIVPPTLVIVFTNPAGVKTRKFPLITVLPLAEPESPS